LSFLPAGLIDRAEVITGAQAARFGAGAMGGVLELSLDNPRHSSGTVVESELQATSLDEANLLLKLSSPWSGGGASAGLYASSGSGRYRYERDLTPSLSSDPWIEETRKHNAQESVTALAQIHESLFGARLKGLVVLNSTQLQVAGPLGNPTALATSNRQRLLLGSSMEWPVRGKLLLRPSLGAYARADQLGYEPGEGAPVSAGSPQHSQEGAFGAYGALRSVVGNHQLYGRLEIEAAALKFQAGRERLLQSRVLPSLVLGDRLNLAKGTLLLDLSGRLSLPSGFGMQNSFSLGSALRANNTLTFLLNLGYATRLPTLFELFRESALLAPNPELSPESSLSVDFGIGLRRGNNSLQASAYLSAYEQLIAYELYPPLKLRATNLRAAMIAGLELEFQLELTQGVHLRGSYAYTDTRNLRDDKNEYWQPLPYRPAHRGDLGLSLKLFQMELGLRVSGQNRMSRNRAATKWMKGWWKPAVTLRSPKIGGCAASLSIDNLFNNRRIQDVFAYPLPGRSLAVALRCQFQPDS